MASDISEIKTSFLEMLNLLQLAVSAGGSSAPRSSAPTTAGRRQLRLPLLNPYQPPSLTNLPLKRVHTPLNQLSLAPDAMVIY